MRTTYIVVWVILALLWLEQLAWEVTDWRSIGMGFATGIILVAFAVEVSGNKSPFSPRPHKRPDDPPIR